MSKATTIRPEPPTRHNNVSALRVTLRRWRISRAPSAIGAFQPTRGTPCARALSTPSRTPASNANPANRISANTAHVADTVTSVVSGIWGILGRNPRWPQVQTR